MVRLPALPVRHAVEGYSDTRSMTARLGELFDRHHERLYRLARRMARDPDEARDLVQDTFLRVARRPGGLPATELGEEAWLVRILVNLCRDRYRRAAVRQRGQPLLEANQADAADPESTLVARATVWTALARLSPRRRAVVVLHELEGRPVAQVAAQLGISRITVRWHLLQARRDLTAFLAPRPSGPRRGLQSGLMRTRRNRRRGEYG